MNVDDKIIIVACFIIILVGIFIFHGIGAITQSRGSCDECFDFVNKIKSIHGNCSHCSVEVGIIGSSCSCYEVC